MPPKRKIDLPDHVRRAALTGVREARVRADRAEEDFKMDVFLKTEQGITQGELAAELGVSQPLISMYRTQGKEVYERRERERNSGGGEDPHRSREHVTNGV
jgi:hypothetical protein